MLFVFVILCFRCLVRCLLPFFVVPPFLGSLFGKIFGSELLFLGGCVGLVFFGGFLLIVFALFFWRFAPDTVWKNSIDVRSGFFWVRSLFLRFFADVVFVFVVLFKRQRSGSHRTPPHTHLSCLFLFLFCVPPLLSVSPVLAMRPASRRFSRGAILGPARFWDSP